MIEILVNAEPRQSAAASLADLLSELPFTPPFAVAVNGEFVPRTTYDAFTLTAGDAIDIVSPVGGG